MLDQNERWFIEQSLKLTGRRITEALPAIKAAWEAGDATLVTVPGAEEHWSLLARLLDANWRWGREHAVVELRQLAKDEREEFSTEQLTPESRGPLPLDAIAWMDGRRELAGKWNRDLDKLVQSVMVEAMREGATMAETVQALKTVFPDFADHRLLTIARTESTAAYARGRLDWFRQPDSGVAAMQLSAVLDERTTAICRERDGLVLTLDDPRLEQNIPPLHFRCRTLLLPITRGQWRRLLAGDQRTTDNIFGWLPEGAPRSLDEATDRWERVPPAQSGFGGAERTVRVAQPTEGGGPGYTSFPPSAALASTDVEIGSTKVRVRRHWAGTGELERVREAIELFREERLVNLRSIDFVDNELRQEGTKKLANAHYVRTPTAPGGYVELSRAAERDWRDSASLEDKILAFQTVVHEIAHHVYYESWSGDKALIRKWSEAMIRDNVELIGLARIEGFPNQFVDYLKAPDVFEENHPHIARVFRSLLQ